jgi:ketosteroid isomerase-like protein
MSTHNLDLIRAAYEANARGDLATMLSVFDPDLKWTYLDPILENPEPQVCRGRHQLEHTLQHWASMASEHSSRRSRDTESASWCVSGHRGSTPTSEDTLAIAPTA